MQSIVIKNENHPRIEIVTKINPPKLIIQNTEILVKHPKCNGNLRKLCKYDCQLCYSRSFASSNKTKYWSERNKESPRDLFLRSGKNYWFECDKCCHEYECSLHNITRPASGCPYCSSKKLCDKDCDPCFNKSFASSNRASCWSERNEISARQIFLNTNKKYWFKCDNCSHNFETSPNNITTDSSWCPYCARQKLCSDNECKTCFNKSFASHEKSIYWSQKNAKSPRESFLYSDDNCVFNCEKCSHEFDGVLKHISKGRWCPFCSEPPQRLCDDNTCKHCFNKSFASHEKSKYWSIKNDISPRKVFKGTSNKYWFNCDKCHHEFNTVLSDISSHNRWCNYCSNKILCDNEKCKTCFDKSFASHKRAKYWSYKNEKSQRQVFLKSNKKYWLVCENGHEFECYLYSITQGGSWCPCCKNKTEKKMLDILSEKYELIHQAKYDWCKNNDTDKYFPFDFELPDYKIIIELDGLQHFEQVMNWKSPEENLERDLYKMNKAIENGYTIIRIFQEDVYYDKNDWLNKLTNSIKIYETPTRIFISSGDQYVKHNQN